MSPGTTAWRRDAWVTAALLGLVLAWDGSGLDLPLTRLFGSPAGFAARDRWWAAQLVHEGGRLLGWGVLAALIAHGRWPLPGWPRLPAREHAWCVLTCLACALLIPLLKHYSRTSCPWDLAEFGGQAAYVSHWVFGQRDGGGGGCFPAGHASSAFSFLAVYFVLRERRPALGTAWLAGVLLLGGLYGLAQLARGAHHLSHTLWTGWICASVSAASFHLSRPWRTRGARAAGSCPD